MLSPAMMEAMADVERFHIIAARTKARILADVFASLAPGQDRAHCGLTRAEFDALKDAMERKGQA